MKTTIHIGATKTGSSALQKHLYSGRQELGDAGILYPDIGIKSDAHHLLFASVHPGAWRLHKDDIPEEPQKRLDQFRRWIDAIYGEAAKTGATHVVLSSEYLWGQMPQAVSEILSSTFASHDMRIVCSIRRQDLWLEASYLQTVKYGETRDFEEWLAHFRTRPLPGLNYLKVLNIWTRMLEPTSFVVIPYEFEDVSAFTRTMIDATCDAPLGMILCPSEALIVNRSPNGAGLKSLLAQNRKMPGKRGGRLSADMARSVLSNERLVLSPARQRELLDEFAETNATIAKRYLGRQDGHLFDESDVAEVLQPTGDAADWRSTPPHRR